MPFGLVCRYSISEKYITSIFRHFSHTVKTVSILILARTSALVTECVGCKVYFVQQSSGGTHLLP
jgi:hypothetical protein